MSNRNGTMVVSYSMRPTTVGLSLLLLWPLHAPAQGLREELVNVSAMLMTRTPSYIPSRGDVVLTYLDQTLILQVSLHNATADNVELDPGFTGWEAALALSLMKDEPTPESRRAIRVQMELLSGEMLGRAPLRAGRAHRLSSLVRPSEPLVAGRYRLRVAMPNHALAGRARTLRNIMTRELVIDIIDPQAPLEQVDYYLNRSYQESSAGRLGQARMWAERALSVHPNSVTALVDLGHYAIKEKDCMRAQPYFEQAIQWLITGVDTDLQISHGHQEEWASALRSALSRHCG